MNALLLMLFLFTGCLAAGAADDSSDWILPDWSFRRPVTLFTGLIPDPDTLAIMEADLAEAQFSSIRIVNSNGQLLPCALRQDINGKTLIAWRLQQQPILSKLHFWLYYSSDRKNPGPMDETIPNTIPGMNLIPNADWKHLDAEGNLADWAVTTRGYGMKEPWTAERREAVQVFRQDGLPTLSFQLPLVVYIKELQEGHIYRLSYQGKCSGKYLRATAWFQGDPTNPLHKSFGNYKNSTAISRTDAWEIIENQAFVYVDRQSEKSFLNNQRLLPGTTWAFLELRPEQSAWLRQLRFEDVTLKARFAKSGPQQQRPANNNQ